MKIVLPALVLLFAATAFASDWASGYPTTKSVLLYRGHVNTTEFEWRGNNLIHAYGIDRTGYFLNMAISGGVDSNFLQFWSHTNEPFNTTVFIYSEPSNFMLGYATPGNERAETTEHRFTGPAPQHFSFDAGDAIIEEIQLLDQTNGTGGYIFRSQGLNTNRLALVMASRLFHGHLDYIVRITAVRPELPGPQTLNGE